MLCSTVTVLELVWPERSYASRVSDAKVRAQANEVRDLRCWKLGPSFEFEDEGRSVRLLYHDGHPPNSYQTSNYGGLY